MKKTKTWKSVGALLLTVAMLAGMLSVVGVIPGSAKTTDAMKFKADFSELAKFVNDNSGTWTSGVFSVGYTPSADTTSLNGQINTWMADRFVIYNTKQYARRAWMGQSSASLQNYKDEWSGNTYFQVKEDGSLKYNTKCSGQMLRKPDMLAVQYKGENAVLKNFEAELVFTRLSANTERSAVILDFHETSPGYVSQSTDRVCNHSGNTVVLGNGAGDYANSGKDGLVFWKQGVPMSATTIDGTATSKADEIKTGDGVRFENSLTSNAWYTLKVRVVNGKVTITVTDASGNTVYTVDKTCDTTEGYLSFGFSNAYFSAKSFTVTELDSEGKQVDFGTNTMSKHDGVEVFEADFSQKLPDATWNGTKYQYEKDHNAEVFQSNENSVCSQTTNAYYSINKNDKALVDLLESKFDFFYAQEGNVFERPNVNGYVVNAEGVEWTGKASANGTVYFPDRKGGSGNYIDGVGPAGNVGNGIAKISLVDGAYITGMNNTTGLGGADGMYRKSFIMRVQGADGEPALLRNFKLEMDFKCYNNGFDYRNVMVSFRTTTPFYRGSTNGAMFAVSRNGGYFVGDDYTIKSGVQYNKAGGATNSHTYGGGNNANYTNYSGSVRFTDNQGLKLNGALAGVYQGAAAETIVGDHHLTLTVVGNTVRAVVTDTTGTVKLDVSDNNIVDAYGYLYIGDSNNAGAFKNIRVTRFSDDSTPEKLIPVDFNAPEEEHTFSANFTGVLERRGASYHTVTGQKGVDTPWITKIAAMPYAFGESAFATELGNKFDFYLNQEGGRFLLANPYDNSTTVKTDSANSVQWKLNDEKTLSAVYSKTNGELFRKVMTMVPKIGDKQIVARDFETEFDIHLPTNHINAAVALGFRSQNAGKWSDHSGGMNTQRGMIVLQSTGIYIADQAILNAAGGKKGTATGIYVSPFADHKSDYYGTYTKASTNWNDNATVTYAHVYVRLIGSALTVKVTSLSGKLTYFDNSAAPFALTFDTAGVLEYAVVGGTGGLSNISLDVLNANGDAVSSDATMPESGTATVSSVQTGLLGYNKTTEEWGIKDKYPTGNPYGVVGDKPKHYTDLATAATTEEDKAKYNALAAEVAANLDAEFLAYYNSRYDLYYNNLTDYRKHTINQNISIGGAAYGNAIYYNKWLQFGGTKEGANTEFIRFNSLVPKKNDVALFGKDVTARVEFRYEYGDAAAIIGFRMATPGKYVDGDGNLLKDASFVRVTKGNGIYLYEGGVERQISDKTFSITEVIVELTVKGDALSVKVKNESNNAVVAGGTATLQKTAQPGYVAATFAGNRMDLGDVSFTISDTAPIVDVAKDMVDGTIELLGRVDSDRAGYYKYLVKAVPDADCQLKIGSLTATNGAEVSLLREGFQQAENLDSNTFAVYTKGDTVVSAEFFTPRTAEEIDRKVLGTQKQAETGGLRFISRFAIDHDGAGVATANIDGKAVAVTDYGVLVAVESMLGTDALELATCKTNPYVVKRSVKEEQVYYDYSSNYIDMSVKITGLAAPLYETLPIVSRGYLVLEGGTVVYTTVAKTTYQNG